MVYLYLKNNQIKAFFLKKPLFGQSEIEFAEKKFQLDIVKNGKVVNTDILASAIKEIVSTKEKDVILILPQEAFSFLRIELPADITSSAITSFLKDKMMNQLSINLDDCFFDYFFNENGPYKEINLYSISQETVQQYQEVLQLLDLKIINILPETISYFKLFEKTLRKDKKELILYGHYDKDNFFAFLYDSFGLFKSEKIEINEKTTTLLEKSLKQKASEIATGNKINRLILSGEQSEKIRQDTFTKNTGLWTNPLKKIINNFYENNLKLFATSTTKVFPVLIYDVCLGTFIFCTENKNFSLIKRLPKAKLSQSNHSSPNYPKPVKKEYLIFIFSFIASFLLFILLSKLNIKFDLPKLPQGPTPVKKITPSPLPPSPTPTPSFDKAKLNIKVLNGSGIAGKASQIKDILKKAGYLEILTGNAHNFEYKNTIIQTKKTVSDVYSQLKIEFKDYTSTLKMEILEATATADVIIIIGQDFK